MPEPLDPLETRGAPGAAYVIRSVRGGSLPSLNADWDAPAWGAADTLEISHFLPETKGHRPAASVRALYDQKGIHLIFRVLNDFARCIRMKYFDDVWKDSCVEFFARPMAEGGYFNFEFNCGGAFLCNYITDWTRSPAGWKSFVRLPWSLAREVRVRSSLPPTVEADPAAPVDWRLQAFLPFAVFEPFVGPTSVASAKWTGNFFKCGEEVPHPHWAAWSPVREFNFHEPGCFGSIHFAGPRGA